jgi:hypothetical protein
VALKCVGELVKLGQAMIVTLSAACGLPDMLLWVEVGCPRWQIDDFKLIDKSSKHGTNLRVAMLFK